jgi:F0F1-type ATP synthase epsilon subunit
MRRAPKPKKLRIKNPDGEWRVIELSGGRYLWNEVEQTVLTAEAVAIECLDADGNVLRAKKLVNDDGESFEADGKDDGSKNLSKAMREQAAMLDAYGRRMNEAFARGAEAASESQDKLVSLVEVLTQHLTLAITNLHNISTNYAQVVAAAGAEDGGNSTQALMGLLGAMTGKLPAAPQPPPANGKAK